MSERKVCECEAQIAELREAAELALDTVGNGGNVDVANALRDALSGDAGRALLERVEALERVAEAAKPVASGVDRGGDCTCFECENGRRLQGELDALDALETKR